MASYSLPSLVLLTIPPPSAPSPPSSFPSSPPSVPLPPSDPFPYLKEFPTQLEDFPAQLEDPTSQTNPYSDCASHTRFIYSVSILQDLVFAVRKDVDDLYFRLEHLDQCVEKIESLFVTLLFSLHAPELATDAPTTSEVFLASVIQMDAENEHQIHLYSTSAQASSCMSYAVNC